MADLYERAPRLTTTCRVCRQPRWIEPLADFVKRPLCARCQEAAFILYGQGLGRVRRHLPNGAERSTGKERAAAFEKALREGRLYEQTVMLLRGARPRGGQQPLAVDWTIEVLFGCGFSDGQIRMMLEGARHEDELTIPRTKGPLCENYVKQRRKLALLPMTEAMREQRLEHERMSQPGALAAA